MAKQVKPNSIRFYKGQWRFTSDGETWGTLGGCSSEDEAIKTIIRELKVAVKPKDITIIRAKELIGKGHLYRIFRLASGNIQIEIRSKEYGDQYINLPKGTEKKDAHIKARKAIEIMSSSDTPELLAKKVLRHITLDQLLNAYLGRVVDNPVFGRTIYRDNDVSDRDRLFVEYFQKREKALCARTLDQYHLIKNGFKDHIEKRLNEDITPYTITRNLSPIRKMYRFAGRRRLWGLIDYDIELRNPLENIEFPEDKSDRTDWYLRPNEELKIYKAIGEQCGGDLLQVRKWMTLVHLAITTALRRGVLLHLKWKDIDWNSKVIYIRKDYWQGGKVAPPMVPLPKRLAGILQEYYDRLPDIDRGQDIPLFENKLRRFERYRKTQNTKPYSASWVDFTWSRIIRRTDICKDVNGETEWFHFHDIRRTAIHRYANVDTYNMGHSDYEYLLGHTEESKNTKKYTPKFYYDKCRRIREAIDNGDDVVSRQQIDAERLSPFVGLTAIEIFKQYPYDPNDPAEQEPTLEEAFNQLPDEGKREVLEIVSSEKLKEE